MTHTILGWDIGGAHLKAAVLNANNSIEQVYLQACPLWQGLTHLQHAVTTVLANVTTQIDTHVITMTGELVDLFASRDAGVIQIIQAMQTYLTGQNVLIYAGQQGFIPATNICKANYAAIASANWLASANLSAAHINTGLFVDIGSTTTDILLCANSQVQALGYTDYQRLQSQELIYTGIVRTAVMALTHTAVFQGQTVGLMAEYFATMADVYRLTGELNEAHDHTATADGTEKTSLASAKRLSRMTGYEFSEQDLTAWIAFAQNLKQQQKLRILHTCEMQLKRLQSTKEPVILGAGIGRFLVAEIATDLSLPYQDFNNLVAIKPQNSELTSADCAPAVAVACLYQQIINR